MDTIIGMSAGALARAIHDRELSSAEIIEAHLQRIEAINPRLNAVVQVTAGTARSQSRAADLALARGESVGPLHGVPMTLKDSIDTAGVITTAGTEGRAFFVPAQDATVAARLRAAGAILLGKTNTPELTLAYETDNRVYGRTNNPYDLSRTPGGSSGGAAAIIAAGGSPLDVGSDTGGSIRWPSHCCGTAGIKPTTGRVPRTGHILPCGDLLDLCCSTQLGPMARRVEDLILTLPLIAGPDGQDPSIVPAPLGDPRRVALQGLRAAFYIDNGICSPAPEIAATVQRAAAVLIESGLAVEEARPAGLPHIFDLTGRFCSAAGGAGVTALLARLGTREVSPLLQPLLSALGSAVPPGGVPAAQLDGWLIELDECRAGMLAFLNDYDLILCPVNAHPALPHGIPEDAIPAFSYTMAYNVTGWPAAVVRAGTSPEGLPIGVQIVARPWREDIALAVAARIEEALGGWQPPVL